MPSTRALPSVRVRFMAAIATVLALVAMGGVTAAPASAEVNAYVAVLDSSTGGAFGPPYQTITLHHVGGQDYSFGGDYSNGFNAGALPDGDYYVTVPNDTYAASPIVHMDGSTTVQLVYVDKFRVTGSVPAAAGNSATSVNVEQLISGDWYPVATGAVTSATGQFEFRVPNGSAEYRLRFLPDATTGYLETYSSSFTIDGSVPAVDLGAVSLVPVRAITGSVLRADGVTPVVGATAIASTGGGDIASAVSDAAGAYRITLPSNDATYTVRVTAAGFNDQEWNVVTAGSDTVAVDSTAGYVRTGIDFALEAQPVTISGTVLNYYSFNSELSIQLYSAGASPALVAETTMGALGAYSFAEIPESSYFIKLVPSGDDSYLPTLLGDGGATEWASTPAVEAAFAVDNSFAVDAADPSTATGHDVNLGYAALIRGTLSDNNSEPIDGCVLVTDVNDPTFSVCADSEGGVWWSLRVPIGGTYTLYASEPTRQYTSEWWWEGQSAIDATPIGPVTGGLQASYYQFFLDVAPASLEISASDLTAAGPITAVVYFKDASNLWRLLGAADAPSVFTEDYYSELDEGLSPGDYRIRFHDSSGRWLSATDYTAGVYPAAVAMTGPTCFIDLPGVVDGAPLIVSASFDSANQPELCGPEVLSYGDVSGHIVSSPTYGSIDVANHDVRIYNERSSRTLTTDSDGSFFYSDLANDSYDIEVLPKVHVPGEHEYTYTATGFDLGDGDVDLGDLVATRYGNVAGQLSDWDNATMAGATVTVYYNDGSSCGCWTPGSISTVISSTGEFEVPGVDADGSYGVRVDFPDTYAPVFLGGGLTAPTDPFTGVAEEDYDFGSVTVDAQELVTVSGTVLFGSTPVNGVVIAIPEGTAGETGFVAFTDVDGRYELEVAPNVVYEVLAFDGSMDLKAQAYGGFNYDFRSVFDLTAITEYTPVAVVADNVTEINFALVAYDEAVFDLSLYSWDSASGYDYFEGVTVHLYKNIAGAWTQVSTFVADGEYAEAYAEVLGDGDYRLRFSKDGAWLAMHELYSDLEYPYLDEVESELEFDPAQCYYDYADLRHGSSVYAEITLLTTPVPSCDPDAVVAPAVVPGTPVKPGAGKPYRSATTVATEAEETPTESVEPTATPTPTPSDTLTDTPSDEPSDAPVAAGPAATSSPDLAWLFWTAGVLILVVLIGGGVLLFRRRA